MENMVPAVREARIVWRLQVERCLAVIASEQIFHQVLAQAIDARAELYESIELLETCGVVEEDLPGAVLRGTISSGEAEPLAELDRLLTELFEQFKSTENVLDWVQHEKWPRIVTFAANALRLMQSNDQVHS